MKLATPLVYSAGLPRAVRLALKQHAYVKEMRADRLTLDQIEHLVHWCGMQDGNLWEGMTLQEIVNVYRISAEYENFESFAEQEGDNARKKWNAVVRTHNQLQMNGDLDDE